MKRFRFTFLAICLILTWLGSSDLILQLRNPEPLALELSALPEGPPPREWLSLSGGHLDLLQGINMSGTIDIDSFLIPLVKDHTDKRTRVWVETRDPAIIKRLKTYYFEIDDDKRRAAYLAAHRDEFFPQRTVTGMTADNLVANNNRTKLIELLGSMGINPPKNILFLSEGKTPNRLRGPAFIILALAGVLKFIFWSKKARREQQPTA